MSLEQKRNWESHPLWGNGPRKSAFLSLVQRYLMLPRGNVGPRNRIKRISLLIKESVAFTGAQYPDLLLEPTVHEINQIRTFLQGQDKSLPSFKFLDCIFRYLCSHCDLQSYPYSEIEGLEYLMDVASQLESTIVGELPLSFIERPINTYNHPLLAVYDRYFGIGAEEIAKCSHLLTGKSGDLEVKSKLEDCAFYNCFRFSVDAGSVVKSFLKFTPPELGHPYLRFQNFAHYKDRNQELPNIRRSEGIVLSIQAGIYCIGRMGSGFAMKIISLRTPNDHDSADLIDGLVTTIDSKSELVTSRILLKKTAVRHSDNANMGVFEADDMEEELTPDELDRLRNVVNFREDREIYDQVDEMAVTHEDLVSTTKKNLMSSVDGENVSRFVFTETGAPFNPARPEDLSFNQAIRVF